MQPSLIQLQHRCLLSHPFFEAADDGFFSVLRLLLRHFQSFANRQIHRTQFLISLTETDGHAALQQLPEMPGDDLPLCAVLVRIGQFPHEYQRAAIGQFRPVGHFAPKLLRQGFFAAGLCGAQNAHKIKFFIQGQIVGSQQPVGHFPIPSRAAEHHLHRLLAKPVVSGLNMGGEPIDLQRRMAQQIPDQ